MPCAQVVEAQHYEANVRREIGILEKMTDHPAIIRLVGWFDTDTAIWMLLSLAQGGDLHGVLTAHGSLSVASTKFLGAEVLLGIEALHANGIVYGDLKPENILLDAAGHVKLADFGSARLLSEDSAQSPPPPAVQSSAGQDGQQQEIVRVEGTAEYVAPEVAGGQTLGSFASDAWAYVRHLQIVAANVSLRACL
jgi:serine/threonine protein kinase